jgi:hypothetical protein
MKSKKNISIRGLNRNCNHDLTNLFKGCHCGLTKAGSFQEFYEALVAEGIRPGRA